ncbi:hypothetical protein Bbelb_203170 [Branchiostoma belcheri]|nr:hypothetical protein Bbelb_203170 [Branchiostoma belcheri]
MLTRGLNIGGRPAMFGGTVGVTPARPVNHSSGVIRGQPQTTAAFLSVTGFAPPGDRHMQQPRSGAGRRKTCLMFELNIDRPSTCFLSATILRFAHLSIIRLFTPGPAMIYGRASRCLNFCVNTFWALAWVDCDLSDDCLSPDHATLPRTKPGVSGYLLLPARRLFVSTCAAFLSQQQALQIIHEACGAPTLDQLILSCQSRPTGGQETRACDPAPVRTPYQSILAPVTCRPKLHLVSTSPYWYQCPTGPNCTELHTVEHVLTGQPALLNTLLGHVYRSYMYSVQMYLQQSGSGHGPCSTCTNVIIDYDRRTTTQHKCTCNIQAVTCSNLQLFAQNPASNSPDLILTNFGVFKYPHSQNNRKRMPEDSAVETLSAMEAALNTHNATLHCSTGSDIIADRKSQTRSWSGVRSNALTAVSGYRVAMVTSVSHDQVPMEGQRRSRVIDRGTCLCAFPFKAAEEPPSLHRQQTTHRAEPLQIRRGGNATSNLLQLTTCYN